MKNFSTCWSDVDFQANTFRVTSYKGKTVNRRVVPITDRLRAALLDLRTKPSVVAFRKLEATLPPRDVNVPGDYFSLAV
jgi:hypothetical protein